MLIHTEQISRLAIGTDHPFLEHNLENILHHPKLANSNLLAIIGNQNQLTVLVATIRMQRHKESTITESMAEIVQLLVRRAVLQ